MALSPAASLITKLPLPSVRCFNMEGEGVSVKEMHVYRRLVQPEARVPSAPLEQRAHSLLPLRHTGRDAAHRPGRCRAPSPGAGGGCGLGRGCGGGGGGSVVRIRVLDHSDASPLSLALAAATAAAACAGLVLLAWPSARLSFCCNPLNR